MLQSSNFYNLCVMKFAFGSRASIWCENCGKVRKPLRGSCMCRVRLVNESSDADRLTCSVLVYAGRYSTCIMNRPRVNDDDRAGRVFRRNIFAWNYESMGDVKYLCTFSVWEKCRRFSRDSALLYSYFHRRIYQGERVTSPLISYRHWRQTFIVRAYTLRVYTILYYAFHLNNNIKYFGHMIFD